MLNCLNNNYAGLWKKMYKEEFDQAEWTKNDIRLDNRKFKIINECLAVETGFRSEFERRQALIEIDVLVALSLNITLNQLITIYKLQFPVLQQYESDTWYDQNGRIVFTNNRSLTNVGFSRNEFEQIKDAKAGEKFYRTIMDDTMPGGTIERTIEYVAPFDKCDRVEDYKTAWEFFTKKYEGEE